MTTIKRKINFFDCDPAGILFYGNIFFLCHSAYEELISSFNLKINYWQNEEFVVPITSSNANYFTPLKTGDEVTIDVNVFNAALLWIMILSSAYFFTEELFIKLLLLVIAIGVTIHLIMVKTKKV